MKKTTIFDYARFMHEYCHANTRCEDCPLNDFHCILEYADSDELTKINEIILKWREEHPVKTRQDEFLKMFPNAGIDENGVVTICPICVDTNFNCVSSISCPKCREEHWLAEVEE